MAPALSSGPGGWRRGYRCWEALPTPCGGQIPLVEEFRASREAAYKDLIAAADRLRQKAAFGSGTAPLLEELGKMEREFRAERRRDYFRSPLRNEAAAALRAVRRVLKEGIEAERSDNIGGSQ